MTTSAPPLRTRPSDPVEVDEAHVEALIKEARQRARRRRLAIASVAGVVALAGLSIVAVLDRTAWSQGSSRQPYARVTASAGATGSRVVFHSTRTQEGPRRGAALYIVGPDGGGKRALTRALYVPPPGSNSPPAWSPDGRRIAFVSVRHHNEDVYVVGLDGNRTQRVTRDPAADLEPAWSPDGGRIAFVSDRHRCTSSGCRGSELYVVNADGSGEQQLTHSNLGVSWPAWSPDGREIVFSSGYYPRGIYVINADGSGLRRLGPGAEDPKWSPDGRSIAYVSATAVSPFYLGIWVMNADGSAKRLVAQGDEPSWSPDGSKIAFLGVPENGEQQHAEISVITADGTVLTRLTSSREHAYLPQWSPDGRSIAFLSDRDGTEQLYVMNPDGSEPRNVSHSRARGTGLFAWSPLH
jgi:TolB protein